MLVSIIASDFENDVEFTETAPYNPVNKETAILEEPQEPISLVEENEKESIDVNDSDILPDFLKD